MTIRVVFAPEAQADLTEIYEYIAERGGPARGLGYVERIVAACERLAMFPERGARRDDIRPGLRVIGFERRIAIAFHLANGIVTVDRVLYGGRDLPIAFETG